jgi:hypothetical protein
MQLQTDQGARVVQENDGLRGTRRLTEGNAATLIDSAVQVYCPSMDRKKRRHARKPMPPWLVIAISVAAVVAVSAFVNFLLSAMDHAH